MSKPRVVNTSNLTKRLNYDRVEVFIRSPGRRQRGRVVTRIANTDYKRYVGLSETEGLDKDEGMLFVYPYEREHRLVMRNMGFPIDIVHIDSDQQVVKVESRKPENDEAVEAASKFALELPHGWCDDHGVKEGDIVSFSQTLGKARRYVESPAEAPEGVEVQEGPQGGLYYETEPEEEDEELQFEVGDRVKYETVHGEVSSAEIINIRDDGRYYIQDHNRGMGMPLDPDSVLGEAESPLETFEAPDNHLSMRDMEDEAIQEWAVENGFTSQHVKVYDGRTDNVEDAYVYNIGHDVARARLDLQADQGGEYIRLGDSGRYHVLSAELWSEMERSEQDGAMRTHFSDTLRHRQIDPSTVHKVQENFFEEGSLTNVKNPDVMRRMMQNMSYLMNEVDRASAGGPDGSGVFHIKISRAEEHSTIAHELGHGIPQVFRYDYPGENASSSYGAYALSHNYEEYAGDWDDFIDWDFSDRSKFYEPEEYMFGRFSEDEEMEEKAVGYSEFKEEVEAELRQRLGEDDNIGNLDEVDYDTVDADSTAIQVVESIEPGQAVQFRVPDWDQGRDEEGNPKGHKADYAKFNRIEEQDSEGHYEAVFERANGDEWRWPIGPDGELYSDWSSIEGVSNGKVGEVSENIGPPEGDTIAEKLASKWSGFNPKAETPDEKMENLARAVNRAWYKQAKLHEMTDDDIERYDVSIKTGYSATNAHETMAQLHEVMQTPERGKPTKVFREHPYLGLAYMDLWEPHEENMKWLNVHLEDMGVEL